MVQGLISRMKIGQYEGGKALIPTPCTCTTPLKLCLALVGDESAFGMSLAVIAEVNDEGGKCGRMSNPTCNDTLSVQVRDNRISTESLYYNYYYPNPRYLITGYLDPPKP